MADPIQRQAMQAALRDLINKGKGVSAATALHLLKESGKADEAAIKKAEAGYQPTEERNEEPTHPTELSREEFLDSITGFLQKGREALGSYQAVAVAVVQGAKKLTEVQNAEVQPESVGKLVTPQAGSAVNGGAPAKEAQTTATPEQGPQGPSLG